jgi:hypothetical protein
MSKFMFQMQFPGLQIRNEEFYKKYGIDIKVRTVVESVDPTK